MVKLMMKIRIDLFLRNITRIYKDGHKSCKAHCTSYIKPRKSSKVTIARTNKRKKDLKFAETRKLQLYAL